MSVTRQIVWFVIEIATGEYFTVRRLTTTWVLTKYTTKQAHMLCLRQTHSTRYTFLKCRPPNQTKHTLRSTSFSNVIPQIKQNHTQPITPFSNVGPQVKQNTLKCRPPSQTKTHSNVGLWVKQNTQPGTPFSNVVPTPHQKKRLTKTQ